MVDEGKELGAPQYEQNGTMTWDFYISASKLVTKHTLLATQEKMKASVTQRRELLKKPTDSKEYKSYGAYVASMTKWKKNTKQWM